MLLDEFLRALPDHYGELLDVLVIEPEEVMRAARVGRLWVLLEPHFRAWALHFDPTLDASDGAKVGQTLHRFGDILPWDDQVKGDKQKRERAQRAAIEAVYVRGEKDSDKPRKAAYWGATLARNDHKHGNPDSLVGQVRATELMVDVIALTAIASIRFRMRLAADKGTPATVPFLPGPP